MDRKCPHCGAPLPESASFCPHCARDIHRRKVPPQPRPLLKPLLLFLLAVSVLSLAGAGLWWLNRPHIPREYDSGNAGEVLYTTGGTEYQLLVAWPEDRTIPAPNISQNGRADDFTRWPSRFYVNYAENGKDAWDEFEAYVAESVVEVEQDPEGASSLTAGIPTHRDDYSPDAAMVASLDFTGDCGSPQVVWTLTMNNGDVIRVRQTIDVTLINTHVYDWHDYPMDTIAELQALLDEIDRSVDWRDEVLIYLPPVTYEGPLYLRSHSYTFFGCTDGTGRTVFTNTVHVYPQNSYWLNFFYDIDFVGNGTGVGLSFGVSGRATDCTFTGWETAVLGYDTAWVNVIGCTLEDNGIGFHFNSTGQSANHTLYNDNIFARNDTAVLLENVPTDLTLDFQGTIFTDNGIDMDNRCEHAVDLSQAIFS